MRPTLRLLCLLGLAPFAPLQIHADDIDPRRPTAIATEHVPTVTDELWDRLRQYQNVRSASFRGWAPDGRGMLVQTQLGNVAQLHRVYEPGGRREQVTFSDEPVSGRFVKGRKDGALLLTSSRGGDENNQIFLLEPETGRPRMLSDGKSRNLLGPVAQDGSFCIVAANRANPQHMDLYRVPLDGGEWEPVLKVAGDTWFPTDLSPDGKRLLLNRYVSINESHPAVLDIETKVLTPLAVAPSISGTVSIGNLRFNAAGDKEILSTDARGEFQQLATLDPVSARWQWSELAPPWDCEEIEVDPHTDQRAYAFNVDGVSDVWLETAGGRRKLDLPEGNVGGLEFSPDGKQLGFTFSPTNAPSEAYSLELAAGKLTRWTFSETGGLNPETFTKPRQIRWKSFDDREISGWLATPKASSAAQKSPVLISIHGGPESQYRPFYSGITQFYLDELGIAVISPNVRGSAGYGKTFLRLDNAEKREESVQDIGALLDWIAAQPDLDASRVAVIGGSYGGFMVLSTMSHYSDRLKCGVDIVGIANFITFLERTSGYRRDLRRAEYGDERDPAMRKVFEEINPTGNAHKIRVPLLVIHGRNDPRVPFSEAEQIAPIVRKNDVPVWTVYADNEGHGFSRRDNRDYQTAVIALFLEAFLTKN